MRLSWKLSSLSKCCCVRLYSPEVLEGMSIFARGRRQGLSRRWWCKTWEEIILKVGAQHVNGVGDDVVDVSGGHNLPCNQPVQWNITSAPEQLPPTTFVLLMMRISVFSSSICKLDFSYFSSISATAFSSFVLLLNQSLGVAKVSWFISDTSNYHITARFSDKVVSWVV